MKPLRALPYFGGKSSAPGSSSGAGPWIAGLLPYRRIYAEPFAGMAGVLLARRPSSSEVVGDADDRIVDWWRAVRDHPAEFGRLVELTPRSRTLYEEAWEMVQAWAEPDLLRRALAVHVCLHYGIMHGLGYPGFASLQHGQGFSRRDIDRLAKRMRSVQIETIDAVALTAKLAGRADAVLYLDPPYGGAWTSRYGVDGFDAEALAGVIADCPAFVAISGYGGDWDHLPGWHRTERRVPAVVSGLPAR